MTNPVETYRRAVDALNRGQFPLALALAQETLRQEPRHAGVHFVAGVALLQLQRLSQALEFLGRAVKLNPMRADYGAQFARALAAARMTRESVSAADQAAAHVGEDALTLDTLGVVYTQAHEHLKALPMFRRAVEIAPQHANYRFNLATVLMFVGDMAGAEEEYEACLGLAPDFWKAHLALSQLRRQSPESNHLARLESKRDSVVGNVEAGLYLNLALAKEYEDLGRFPDAFDALRRGKEPVGKARGYSTSRDEALFDALRLAFPEEMATDRGYESREPIFVVGMPRSGTTLVDRILSTHPEVYSAGELQNFSVELKKASRSPTRFLIDPDTVARGRNVDPRALGEAYIASTRPATGLLPRFVDKLPHNFLYLPFIAAALPRARIICLRRNPLDVILSNFRQLFAQTSPYYDYSFDVLDTARYYVLFHRLMEHWRRVLPGRILEMSYEALVEEQEVSTRRLLEFCDLKWDERCLNFERNEAPVATASVVQVREPLNRASLYRWKRYEAELAPVREILEQAEIPY